MNTQESDLRFIKIAFQQANINYGLTSNNPSVGVVIVKDNKILSKAVTGIGGTPHAEVLAISQVSAEMLEGSTLYSTLEPCCHFGKTPPCVGSIISNKIKRVVIAFKDIEDRINGQGIKILQQNNISVTTVNKALLSTTEQNFYEPYFFAKINKRSFVTVKYACSLDGKIATQPTSNHIKTTTTKTPTYISSNLARTHTHLERKKADGILVGSATFKADNPRLTCRLSNNKEYSTNYSPKRFILSNTIKQQDGFNIVSGNIESILQETFSTYKVNSLIIEGGQNTITQALNEKMVNRLTAHTVPIIIGENGISLASTLKNPQSINFTLINSKTLHSTSEIITEYKLSYT